MSTTFTSCCQPSEQLQNWSREYKVTVSGSDYSLSFSLWSHLHQCKMSEKCYCADLLITLHTHSPGVSGNMRCKAIENGALSPKIPAFPASSKLEGLCINTSSCCFCITHSEWSWDVPSSGNRRHSLSFGGTNLWWASGTRDIKVRNLGNLRNKGAHLAILSQNILPLVKHLFILLHSSCSHCCCIQLCRWTTSV